MPEQKYQLRAELRAIQAREVIGECQRHDVPALPEWLAGPLMVGALMVSQTAPLASYLRHPVEASDYFTFRNGVIRVVPAVVFEEQYAPVQGGCRVTAEKSKCRACGAPLRWERSESGKWVPISIATGESHFRDCPNANEFSGRNR